jgi:hypothetical protein
MGYWKLASPGGPQQSGISPEAKKGAEVSTQYGGFARLEHQGQLVGESLTLSLSDGAVFLYLLRAID